MKSLEAIFPANDFTLIAVIIGLPLIGAFINGVFGKRLGKQALTLMALSALAGSFLGSVVAFFMIKTAQTGDTAVRLTWNAWRWMTLNLPVPGSPGATRDLPVDVAFSMDALNATMALIVTGIGFLIHLYSTKYMEHDAGYTRFFAYLNLFIFSMLVLILGDSLPILFVGWEGVGLCSYLLIGFWYEETANAAAGKKAFIANRIGDFGLLAAMAMLAYYSGALDWAGITAGSEALAQKVQVWPIGREVPLANLLPEGNSVREWMNKTREVNASTLIGLAVFLGCAGKSAQIPLYVWLPDAMAGPTPVSALIHAATMVTAGVYLMCRMAPVFVMSPAAMIVVAFIGALTALLAASIALVQNDIKKVLAYSTVSQLGYMFLGAGVGAFSAGFFHVITHAFFKACLFLGAGSVIHAMHARVHDHDASQDMRNMGGLRQYMPLTHGTFLVSCLAIAGLPLTSGFFSKDEILFKAWTSSVVSPFGDGKARGLEIWQWPPWAGKVLFTIGIIAAVMTAFYMFRLYFRTFWGEFKGWNIVKSWKDEHHDAHEDHGDGHDDHHAYDPDMDGPVPQESPPQMTAPLVILAALAAVGGALNAHAFFHSHILDDFLAPVFGMQEFAKTGMEVVTGVSVLENSKALMLPLLAPGVLAFVIGAGLAYWMYVMQRGEPAANLANSAKPLHRMLLDKWRVDELYEETVIGAVDSLAEFFAWADKWIVDGVIARLSAGIVQGAGAVLRLFQTGRVHAYGAVMAVGLGGVGWFMVAPHATAKPSLNHATGKYTVTAAPGLGYTYRWDADGDGKFDTDRYGSQAKIEFQLERGKSRKVWLEVRNAFGRVTAKSYSIARPAEPAGKVQGLVIERGADGKIRPAGTPAPPPGTPRPGGAGSPIPPDVLKKLQNLQKGGKQ